ncbi:MAG: hypothetical protein HC872_04235 [Gammaproteobacteria bacterium]|nr:hypothetical protein [Gammaproteobacteria bacterium]
MLARWIRRFVESWVAIVTREASRAVSPQVIDGLMSMMLRSCELDVRTGGQYRLVFGDDPANAMACFAKYLDVVPNQRIVWRFESNEILHRYFRRTRMLQDSRGTDFIFDRPPFHRSRRLSAKIKSVPKQRSSGAAAA